MLGNRPDRFERTGGKALLDAGVFPRVDLYRVIGIDDVVDAIQTVETLRVLLHIPANQVGGVAVLLDGEGVDRSGARRGMRSSFYR